MTADTTAVIRCKEMPPETTVSNRVGLPTAISWSMLRRTVLEAFTKPKGSEFVFMITDITLNGNCACAM
jgi:hypothetical protein